MVWYITYRGLMIRGDDDVYKPGEDSILLASNIEELSIQPTEFSIDFGSGSGIISIVLGLKKIYVAALDISLSPCKYTSENIRDNGLDGYVDVICSSHYLDLFRRDLNITVFSNPPYLPVDYKGFESRIWAGGAGGLETVKKILESLNDFYCFQIYIILSSYTDTVQFKNMIKKFSLNIEKLDSLSFPSETIYLYHIWRGCE